MLNRHAERQCKTWSEYKTIAINAIYRKKQKSIRCKNLREIILVFILIFDNKTATHNIMCFSYLQNSTYSV